MKAFLKEFVKRGSMFCGGGPLILAIIYMFLPVETVGVSHIVTEILTSLLLAFIAAGISAIYTVEKIPYPTAGLIQGSVLLADYLTIYLINGWIPVTWQSITMFVTIFVAAFLTSSLIIYHSIKVQIEKLNKQIK